MSKIQPDGPAQLIRPTIMLNAGGTTCLGSGSGCDRQLDHPLIAARHVEFLLGATPTLRDLGAGTFVNGQKIVGKSIAIQPGDQIDVGPYAFSFTGFQLEATASMDYVQLTAIGLTRTVPDAGGERTLIDKITLVFQPGEFVCLLGPSGCGKSTLMNALSGRHAPTTGEVRVNQRHLYAEFEVLKNHIVHVPQESILHSALGVRQALRFTARLRLPNSHDRLKRVDELLATLQLDKQATQPIWSLSGGQRKRVSLANEMLSDPGLIFLDEVTSGLDPHIDADLMRQLKEIAEEKRKTIVCVTHSIANVAANCHQVVFLTEGGRLAFVGTPQHAMKYFDVDRLDQVYPMLTAENADVMAGRFANSPEYAAYLDERLPEEARPTQALPIAQPGKRRGGRTRLLTEIGIVAVQTMLLAWRQVILFTKDFPALVSLFGQVILVSLVLILAFGAIDPVFPQLTDQEKADKKDFDRFPSQGTKERLKNDYMPTNTGFRRLRHVQKILDLTFLLAVVSLWFGCNNAAREIVRERSITTQEMYFNLRPSAYFLSKISILTLVSWLQVSLMMAAIWWWCRPPEDAWHALPILFALAFAGIALGLFISAVSSSDRVAVTLIPIAIIPQLVLSGAIVKLESPANTFAQVFVTAYWGKQGMDGLFPLAKEVAVEEPKDSPKKIGMKAKGKTEEDHMADPGTFARAKNVALVDSNGTALPLAMILLHSTVFAMLTLAALSTDGTISSVVRMLGTWFGSLVPNLRQRANAPPTIIT